MDKTLIRIVVIEDERELRLGLQTLLNFTPGFRCVRSCSAKDKAIRAIREDAADLVLTHIGLPRLSSIEGIRILREKFPALPIVAFTVYGEDDSG